MTKNIFKIVLLGLLGFAALVYLTVPEKTTSNTPKNNEIIASKDTLPAIYELVGQSAVVSKNELFKENQPYLIIVGNHDSLAVVKDLKKYFNVDMSCVLVANISSAPWFVKKMFIPSKLEELNKQSHFPMIYDFDGTMAQALNVTNNEKTAFVAYMLDENKTISKIYEGRVKEGALEGSMSDDEKKEVLSPLIELL